MLALRRARRAGPGAATARRLTAARGAACCSAASPSATSPREGAWRSGAAPSRRNAFRRSCCGLTRDLAAGAAGELVAELEQLVAEHPFEERLWGQLMLALFRAGRQADALEAFQRARRVLSSELGLEPGEPLVPSPAADPRRRRDVAATLRPRRVRPRRRPRRAPSRSASNLPRAARRGSSVVRASSTALAGLLADPDVQLDHADRSRGRRQDPARARAGAAPRARGYGDGARLRSARAAHGRHPDRRRDRCRPLPSRRRSTASARTALPPTCATASCCSSLDNFEHLLDGARPGRRPPRATRRGLADAGRRVGSRCASVASGSSRSSRCGCPPAIPRVTTSESPAVQMFLQCALATNRRLEIDAGTTRTSPRHLSRARRPAAGDRTGRVARRAGAEAGADRRAARPTAVDR